MNKQSSSNLIAIQILRCVAALLVVIWHSHLSIKLFTHNYWPDGDAFFRVSHFPSWANHLGVGVDIFFCISGFIMTMLAERATEKARNQYRVTAKAGHFIVDRFARILPPYWFFTIVVLSVYAASPAYNVGHLTGDWWNDAPRLATSFLLVPQETAPVLGVGWTLIHEFLFYYFVAVVILVRQGRRLLVLLAGAAGVAFAMYLADFKLFYGYGLSPYYIEFFAGALAYRTHARTSGFYPEMQCALAVVLYFVISALIDHYPYAPSMLVPMLGFGSMGFLLISGLIGLDGKYKLAQFLLPRLMARIGDASYTLYLSHWFVLSFIGKFAASIQNIPAPIIVIWHITAITIAVSLAVLFAELVELPLHRRLVNYIKSRRFRGTAADEPKASSSRLGVSC